MKNTVTLAIAVLFTIGLSFQGQSQLKWNFVPEETTSTHYILNYLGESDYGYGFVFLSSIQKNFGPLVNKIGIRYYDSEMKTFTQKEIPTNTPSYISTKDFGPYIVLLGSGIGYAQGKGDASMQFLDQDGIEVGSKTLKHGGERYLWGDNPETYYTFDTSYLIVVFYEQCVPEKPSAKTDPIVQRITVFDRDLQTVWEGTLDLKKCFEKDKGPFSTVLDYDPDLGLLIIGMQRYESQLYSVAYSIKDPQQSPERRMFVQTGDDDYFEFKHFITKDKQLVIISYDLKDYTQVTGINFVSQKLDDPTALIVGQQNFDKAFETKFPSYANNLKQFPKPKFVFCMDDGVIVAGEYILSGLVEYSKYITLIKFDFDGKIQWAKMIEKSSGLTGSDDSFNAFKSGNDLVLFYHDNPENVGSSVFKAAPRVLEFEVSCMAVAIVTPTGDIEYQKIVNHYGQSKIKNNLNCIYQVDMNTFFFKGSRSGENAYTSYTLD